MTPHPPITKLHLPPSLSRPEAPRALPTSPGQVPRKAAHFLAAVAAAAAMRPVPRLPAAEKAVDQGTPPSLGGGGWRRPFRIL